MKAKLWKLIQKWRDATTTEAAWIARDQIDIELDKIELAARQEPVGSVTVSPWRGLENIEWQQSVDIPEGTHMLYLAAGAYPAPCNPLCELCIKRGYTECANVTVTTPLPMLAQGQRKP